MQRQEPVFIQAFRPQFAVEGFEERIVRQLAWPTEVEFDLVPLCPLIERLRRKLLAIVYAEGLWPTTLADDLIQHGHKSQSMREKE